MEQMTVEPSSKQMQASVFLRQRPQ